MIPRRVLPALLAAPFLAQGVMAQDAFPTRGISIIVPFPPGGGTDVLARILAQHFQESF